MIGNGPCKKCPEFSESPKDREDKSYCDCIFGYYRHVDEDENKPCTRPPSKPRNLEMIKIDARKIKLSWLPPEDNGGRSDIFYKIDCHNCNDYVLYDPARDNLKQTKYVT